MLTTILAHQEEARATGESWGAWNLDPVILGGLVLAGWAHRRGRLAGECRTIASWRSWCFLAGVLALALALVSPLDAMAHELASAHMVQHVLVLLVAAPLLAIAGPLDTVLRGSPRPVRRAMAMTRRRLHLRAAHLRALRQPLGLWGIHVLAVWVWHSSALYGATLENELVHAVEHGIFLITGVLFWGVIAGPRRSHRVSPGFGVLLIFATAMQSVFLSALLTFAGSPWYGGYTESTARWGTAPLADQQLAGVIMWVPASAVYLAAALTLVVVWIREAEVDAGQHQRAA